MANRTMRFGLVGVGKQGSNYPMFVKGSDLSQPLGEIVALADVDGETLRRVAAEMDVELTHCYADTTGMVNNESLDAVIVATPASVREPVITVLEAGKHVFCENPLSSDLKVANEILTMYSRCPDQIFTVNEQWLWLPGVQKIKKMVEDGVIGELKWVTIGGKGRDPVTELVLIGSHLLSVVIHFFTGRACDCVVSHEGQRADYEAIHCPLTLDLRTGDDDVERCYLQVDGSKGRVRAMGRFLESVYRHPEPYDSGAMMTGFGKWVPVEVPGVGSIKTGMESQAQADAEMNPTYWLMEQFVMACRGEAENPYPPDKYAPVVQAMETYRRKGLYESLALSEEE